MSKLLSTILLFLFGFHGMAQKVVLSGTVHDVHSGEPLIGVSVFDSISGVGATTNPFGFYSITLPANTKQLRYSYIGYKTFYRDVDLTKTTSIGHIS